MNLVQRCTAEQARHAFVTDARTAGPNVFHDCAASECLGCAETHHRWASGVLFDNVRAPVAIQNRSWMGSGHGWSGANCLVWNCRGDVIVQQPPTAWNFAVGLRTDMTRGKASFPAADDELGYIWRDTLDPPSYFAELMKYN
jgi:hypothetical protein